MSGSAFNVLEWIHNDDSSVILPGIEVFGIDDLAAGEMCCGEDLSIEVVDLEAMDQIPFNCIDQDIGIAEVLTVHSFRRASVSAPSGNVPCVFATLP